MPKHGPAGSMESESRDRIADQGRATLTSPRFCAATGVLLLLLLLSALLPATVAPHDPAPDLSAYPWLYRRYGEPVAADKRLVEVILAGDVMPARGVADVAAPLAAVAPWLRAADLAFGNLECVIAENGTARAGPYRLRAPARAAGYLAAAGFDVLGLANNHALDYGPEALEETVARLKGAGVATVGAGAGADAAAQPLIREVGRVRLAFLAFNAVPDPDDAPTSVGAEGWTRAGWDEARAVEAVAAARALADAVIVSVHWGYEYELRPGPAQRAMARALADAGADLVVGHHPHVVQGTEVRGETFVAYSLGNFLFDQQRGDTRHGLALRAFFDGDGLRAVQAIPVWAGPRPRLRAPADAAAPDELEAPAARRVGVACDAGGCRQADVPSAPRSGGLFTVGQIDLTGDGVAEEVRREGEAVVIYEGGVEVWRTRPAWRVADAALGDPNDDGRGELLVAFSQPEAGGGMQSQPFVVGYRRGGYRVLWGGSGVAQAIHEVALDDVDGDGAEELVVLEEAGDRRTVSVWTWHGWGFFLEWRSEPGAYRDLALERAGGEGPATIVVAVGR